MEQRIDRGFRRETFGWVSKVVLNRVSYSDRGKLNRGGNNKKLWTNRLVLLVFYTDEEENYKRQRHFWTCKCGSFEATRLRLL